MISKALSTSQKYARLHQVAGKLAEFCQTLYPLLVAHSDDFGRQSGDVFTVKHAVCPTSPRKMPEVQQALKCLHEVGLIVWYEAEGLQVIQVADFDKHQSGLHKRAEKSKFHGNSGNPREIPGDSPLRELKGTEEKRTELKGTELKDAGASTIATAPTDHDPAAPEGKVEAFVRLWNETVKAPIGQCKGVSDTRRAHIRARLKERTMEDWADLFRKVQASEFLRGHNDRKWVASFDWIIEYPNSGIKVLEGKYDNRDDGSTWAERRAERDRVKQAKQVAQ